MNKIIKLVKGEKSWIESSAIDQLKRVAELVGIMQAVGLPDLHPGKTPVGAAYLSKDIIYPHIIGNDIGCGLALFNTGFSESKFKIDKVTRSLSKLNSLDDIQINDLIEGCTLPFKEKLGTIGSGNHFAELQTIGKVYNREVVQKIGLEQRQIVLLVHSGSRSYGEFILDRFIKQYSCQNGLAIGSDGFKQYLAEHDMALEFAKLNRELIALRILMAINAKDHIKLLDSVHNSVTEKQIDDAKYYIHRKGAAPSDTGYIVIAGTRGTSSYIVEPKPDLSDYLFSVSHGAGRKWSRTGCKERLDKTYSKKILRQDQLLTIIYKDQRHIYEEAPEAYKDIERVIGDMLDAGMIKLVASLNPLITCKI